MKLSGYWVCENATECIGQSSRLADQIVNQHKMNGHQKRVEEGLENNSKHSTGSLCINLSIKEYKMQAVLVHAIGLQSLQDDHDGSEC